MIPEVEEPLQWQDGTWWNPPEEVVVADDAMVVTARHGSDLWRETLYGYTSDTGHALLFDFEVGDAIEVDFVADFHEQFDQAGLLVRHSPELWLKAGAEQADGALQVGAVATRNMSDWALHPRPDWSGRPLSVRVSRGPDALTVRFRSEDGPWLLTRVAPFPTEESCQAGPFVCAPTRAGLEVSFTRLSRSAADKGLHE